jgi:hypothetical protein
MIVRPKSYLILPALGDTAEASFGMCVLGQYTPAVDRFTEQGGDVGRPSERQDQLFILVHAQPA